MRCPCHAEGDEELWKLRESGTQLGARQGMEWGAERGPPTGSPLLGAACQCAPTH